MSHFRSIMSFIPSYVILFLYIVLVLFIFSIASYLLWRRTEDKKALFYAFSLLFQVAWILSYITAAFSPKIEDKIFWDTIIIFSLYGILISYLLFSLEYNGIHFEKRPILFYCLIGIAFIQFLPVFFFIDNPLFRFAYEIRPISEDFSALINETGWYLNILMSEGFILTIVPVGLFVRNLFLKSRSKLIKKQSLMIFASFSIIIFQFIFFNWAGVLGLLEWSVEINLSAFFISNVLILIAVGPLQTFEVLPTANKKIIDNIGDGYCVFNRFGLLLEINQELMDILGIMDKNKVIGKKPAEIFVQHPNLMKFAQSIREGKIEISFSLWDEAVYFEVKKVNLYRFKRYIGYVISFHNVTSRKEHEQNLKASKEDLEQKFLHSQKLDSIGQLAGGIAHEFNNLLTIILGNSQLIELNGHLRREDQLLLDEVSDAAKTASRLTKQLLTIGRKNVIHPSLIDVNQQLQKMNNLFLRLIGKDDIRFSMILNTNCGKIFADIGLMEQILINLVLNAKDAMPEGGEIELSTECVSINEKNIEQYPDAHLSDYSCIRIRDTGTGMSSEVQAHIFEPFYTTKPREKGSGLGLSMVLGAIKQFRGFITVESEFGHGSTFRIFIPEMKKVESETRFDDTSQNIQKGNRELILVVEDDMAVRSTVSEMLKSLNYNVVSFGNGSEAITYYKKNSVKIDMVFTDIVMQGIKGNELAKEVQKINPKVKVLFASGYTDKVIAKYGVLYKDTHFIPKPFSFELLAQKIYEILNS